MCVFGAQAKKGEKCLWKYLTNCTRKKEQRKAKTKLCDKYKSGKMCRVTLTSDKYSFSIRRHIIHNLVFDSKRSLLISWCSCISRLLNFTFHQFAYVLYIWFDNDVALSFNPSIFAPFYIPYFSILSWVIWICDEKQCSTKPKKRADEEH